MEEAAVGGRMNGIVCARTAVQQVLRKMEGLQVVMDLFVRTAVQQVLRKIEGLQVVMDLLGIYRAGVTRVAMDFLRIQIEIL
jgi:hypothetical protein